ncbi:putative transcription factor B3-Domain family [Medicago truncatula]|nr:putative B3 domain-containing protein Os03g0621600 isoform X2 [Medicago truncatula]RHN65200.1 putative transcription factor B3-Domain family [Medicago truncatula]
MQQHNVKLIIIICIATNNTMQPHRRRCGRSPAPEKASKHFMKAILPPPDHTKEIRIPNEFIKRFGNELKNVATITVPDGRHEWEMGLKKCGEHVFLSNNWQQFAEYYCIYYGCYLDFNYQGNSKFNVVIYDTTSVEISYSFKTPSTNGDQRIKGPNSASKRENCAASEFNPKNPYFYSKSNRGFYAYVPSIFAEKYLTLKVPFKLQNSQGKQWEVYCVLHNKGNSQMRITGGFGKFARENNLLEGVTYVFELIKRKPVVVLQVTAICTPPQGRSVQSMTEKEVRESKHFKKAILPSPIHDKEIRIPEDFITMFGNELEKVATVTVPDGRDWKMRLKKRGNDIFFSNEWEEFAKYYSLGVNGEPNTKCASPTKRSKVETSECHGKKAKSVSKHASTRAEVAANEFKPKNPYFCSIIAKQNYTYIPRDFAEKYLKPKVPTKLQNSDGKQWEVFCVPNTVGSSSMRIVKGFSNFVTDNNLSHRDYCVYELIKKKPVVLEVTMFRAVDYLD